MMFRSEVSCLSFRARRARIRLPQIVLAGGTRCANNDMGFWSKGREVALTMGGKSETCHTNLAYCLRHAG